MQISIITSRGRQWTGLMILLLTSLTLFVSVAQAATITVNTTDDEVNMDDDCSLREAIIAANTDAAVDACPAGNGADTISLEAGEYVLTRAGKNENAALTGDLDLTADVTIIGAGQTTTIINGNDLDRVFEIAANRNVQISDVTVIGGHNPTLNRGGGLMINEGGTLTLINSTISDNDTSNGGGIFIDDGGTATLMNSWVNGNDGFEGGGIYVDKDATLTITNSQVSDNTTSGGGAGIFINEGSMILADSQVSGNDVVGSDGGGIYISYSTAVTLTNSQITGNTTDNAGGGIYVDNSTLTITSSQVSSNTAISDGGGIFLGDSTLTITSSQVSGNSITGIYVDGNSTLMFTNGQIIDNTSTTDAAGLYNDGTATLVNSTVSGNSAANDGGGIYNDKILNLRNVTIANNTADSDGDDDGDGGGVYIHPSGAILTATNSIIGGNFDNSPAGPQRPDCSGTLTNPSYNLVGVTTGCMVSGTPIDNIINASPNLGPLQDNGGDMLTHALLANSPAIDAGDPSGCLDQNGLPLTTDQRNYIRPVDGDSNGSIVCDMGAYEFNSPGPASPEGTVIYLPLIQK